MQPLEPLVFKDDRYGGVEVDVTDAAARMEPAAFATALRDACDSWAAQGKCGIWLRVPTNCGGAVGAAAANGFDFHHAQPGYAMLTRWLHTVVPSTLPKYGFTQIGVGGVVRAWRIPSRPCPRERETCRAGARGVNLGLGAAQVVNSRGEVLMVQEKVAPIPQFQVRPRRQPRPCSAVENRTMPRPRLRHSRSTRRLPPPQSQPPSLQGAWKVPGGLADPGEDFATTAIREVRRVGTRGRRRLGAIAASALAAPTREAGARGDWCCRGAGWRGHAPPLARLSLRTGCAAEWALNAQRQRTDTSSSFGGRVLPCRVR